MKIPPSFFVFRKLMESPLQEVDPSPSDTTNKSLSFECDRVLSHLHGFDDLRDAVIGSNANPRDSSLLFILNPALQDVKHLAKTIQQLDSVVDIAFGKRKHPKKGEDTYLMKVKVRTKLEKGGQDKNALEVGSTGALSKKFK